MKRYPLFFLSIIFLFTITSHAQEIEQNVESIESVEITISQICEPFGIEESKLAGVTFTDLPDNEAGVLVCEGVPLERYDYVSAEQLKWLVYVSFNQQPATFSYIPNAAGEQYQSCTASLMDNGGVTFTATDGEVAFAMVRARYWSCITDNVRVVSA